MNDDDDDDDDDDHIHFRYTSLFDHEFLFHVARNRNYILGSFRYMTELHKIYRLLHRLLASTETITHKHVTF